MKAGEIIGLFMVIVLGASLLPSALATWYEATGSVAEGYAANGSLYEAPAAFQTMWDLVPLGVALTIFAGIVYVAIRRM